MDKNKKLSCFMILNLKCLASSLLELVIVSDVVEGMRSQGSPAYRDLSGWPLSRLLPPAPDPWLVSQFQRFLCGKTRGFTPISKSRFFFFLHN